MAGHQFRLIHESTALIFHVSFPLRQPLTPLRRRRVQCPAGVFGVISSIGAWKSTIFCIFVYQNLKELNQKAKICIFSENIIAIFKNS